MTKSEVIDHVVKGLSERAHTIADDGHSPISIMKSAMTDFNGLGGMSCMLSIMTTEKLNAHQTELAKRIAVYVVNFNIAYQIAFNEGNSKPVRLKSLAMDVYTYVSIPKRSGL